MPEAATHAPSAAPGFDAFRAASARMYDYFLSGKDNYAVDRDLAERIRAAAPVIRVLARANRDFLARAVRTLARCGVRQFLDLGCGLPVPGRGPLDGNVHEIAARAAPGCRVVYVDSDPMVVAHAQALMAGTADTAAVSGDARAPATFLSQRRVHEVLDFERPVAVLLTAVLHHLPDEDDPAAVVGRIRDLLVPGSHLVLSHAERTPALTRAAVLHAHADLPLVPRDRDAVAGLLAGTVPLEPGLVRVPGWRPDDDGRPRPAGVPLLGAVAEVS